MPSEHCVNMSSVLPLKLELKRNSEKNVAFSSNTVNIKVILGFFWSVFFCFTAKAHFTSSTHCPRQESDMENVKSLSDQNETFMKQQMWLFSL